MKQFQESVNTVILAIDSKTIYIARLDNTVKNSHRSFQRQDAKVLQ
jgi:hypothetical protein